MQQEQLGPQSHSSPSSSTQLPQEGPSWLIGELALRQESKPSASARASPALLQLDHAWLLPPSPLGAITQRAPGHPQPGPSWSRPRLCASSCATTIPTCAPLIPFSQKATPPEKLLLQIVPRSAFPTTPALSRTPVSRWTVCPGGHLVRKFTPHLVRFSDRLEKVGREPEYLSSSSLYLSLIFSLYSRNLSRVMSASGTILTLSEPVAHSSTSTRTTCSRPSFDTISATASATSLHNL